MANPVVIQRQQVPGQPRNTAQDRVDKTVQTAIRNVQDQVDAIPRGTVTDIETTAPITGGPITGAGSLGLDQTFLFGPVFRQFVSTTNHTFGDSDVTVFSDTTSADTAVVCPDPTTNAGRVICIARTGAVNKVTLTTTGGHNIDGAASQELGTANNYAGSTVFRVVLQSDGSQWISVAWCGKTA